MRGWLSKFFARRMACEPSCCDSCAK
jgi:hypothetical protein